MLTDVNRMYDAWLNLDGKLCMAAVFVKTAKDGKQCAYNGAGKQLKIRGYLFDTREEAQEWLSEGETLPIYPGKRPPSWSKRAKRAKKLAVDRYLSANGLPAEWVKFLQSYEIKPDGSGVGIKFKFDGNGNVIGHHHHTVTKKQMEEEENRLLDAIKEFEAADAELDV